MSDKKTISINASYFGPKIRQNQTRSKKPKPLSIISPNDLKRTLIRKVKEHQNNLKNSYQDKTDSSEKSYFPDEFKESLDYLVNLSKQQKTDNHHKEQTQSSLDPKTITKNETSTTSKSPFYNNQSNFSMEQVDIDLPSTLQSNTYVPILKQSIPISKDDKPYGNLKNGVKPTYRSYMKTLKNKSTDKISSFAGSRQVIHDNQMQKKTKTITKQIKTRKYKCGKNKHTRQVGVLLKSGKMRSKVLAERQTIKSRPYVQMKNELYKKGFLKIGSNAPRSLVTEIYENCILSGDVMNKNKEVLIHNYINDKSPL